MIGAAAVDAQTELLVTLFLPAALAIIMFSMGLGLAPADFRRVAERPRAVAAGAVAQLLVLPALGFLFAWAFGLPPTLAIGMVLICACPGGPTSNLLSFVARGDVALSVSLTAVSGVVTVFTIPSVTNLAVRTFAADTAVIELPVLLTIVKIAAVVLAPVAAGMWVRARYGNVDRLERRVQQLSFLLLGVIVVGAVLKERTRVLDYIREIGLAVVLLNGLAMGLGYAIGRVLRLDRKQSVTISIEVGMQNGALAIGIALTMPGGAAIAIPAVVYGLWAYFSCGAVALWGRRGAPPATVDAVR